MHDLEYYAYFVGTCIEYTKHTIIFVGFESVINMHDIRTCMHEQSRTMHPFKYFIMVQCPDSKPAVAELCQCEIIVIGKWALR